MMMLARAQDGCMNAGASRHSLILEQIFLLFRSKYEERILNTAKSKNKNEVVRLLSLGSGGLFQDLMIILRLYYNGYKTIELDCFELVDNQAQQSILQAIIARLNQLGAKITVRHFKNWEERGAQNAPCDAVYAIDFDDIGYALGSDFSSRQLPFRSKNEQNDSICTLFLGAYAELNQSPFSLFLLTFGKNYIAHNGGKAELYCDEFDHQFEKRIEPHAYHDYYYINASVVPLLMHLPFLKAKKKPLLINEAILNPSTTLSLQKLLAQHKMDYLIASESSIGKKLDEECASVLIIDDSMHDSSEPEEHYIHPIFKHGHAQVSRVNYPSSKVDVFFAFNAIKTEQLAQKINNLPIETYLERTAIGIQNYLDWCSKNASGTRGLTRFSHWYHGDSGVRRAQALQKTIKGGANQIESLNHLDEEKKSVILQSIPLHQGYLHNKHCFEDLDNLVFFMRKMSLLLQKLVRRSETEQMSLSIKTEIYLYELFQKTKKSSRELTKETPVAERQQRTMELLGQLALRLVLLLPENRTLLNSVVSQSASRSLLIPLSTQIISVLCLLGIDSTQENERGRLLEVLTGQGKSWVLALTAAVLAMLGKSVDVVCYHPDLSLRDGLFFKHIFPELAGTQVSYHSCQQLLARKEQVNDLQHRLADILLGRRNVMAHSAVEESKQEDRVLLVDEADVFFGQMLFQSEEFKVLLLEDEFFTVLRFKIWQHVMEQKTDIEVHIIPRLYELFAQPKWQHLSFMRQPESKMLLCYYITTCLAECAQAQQLIQKGTSLAPGDLTPAAADYFVWNTPTKAQNSRQKNLCLCVEDSSKKLVLVSAQHPFVFLYYFDYYKTELGIQGSLSKFSTNELPENLLNETNSAVFKRFLLNKPKSCHYSYQDLPKQYALLLGVTGTLKELHPKQSELLDTKELGLKKRYYSPSIFGGKQNGALSFNRSTDVSLEADNQWFSSVYQKIKHQLDTQRSVLLFFDAPKQGCDPSTTPRLWSKKTVSMALRVVAYFKR